MIYWYIISYHSNKCKVIDLGHGCAEGAGDDFQKIYRRKSSCYAAALVSKIDDHCYCLIDIALV